MSKENKQNNVNQDGRGEHEQPHGDALPLAEQQAPPPRNYAKRQGRAGQQNFIPGAAPVGQREDAKPVKRSK